jgi:DNA-binding MarR family transcriptional regulator
MNRKKKARPALDSACACFNLRKAARAVTQVFEAALEPSGLKATQFSVLMVLANMGTAPLGQVARGLVMDRTTLSRNLRPLEKMKLIRIRPGKDPRVREISLTAAGRRKVDQTRELWRPAQTRFTEGMGEGPFADLLKNLDRIVALAHPTGPE